MNNFNQINWSDRELFELKSKILRRITTVWFLRRVLAPASFVLAASGAVLFYAIKAQHVAMIVKNISERLASFDLFELLKYLLVAVQRTELDLFVLSLSATLLAAYFGRRLVRESINFFFGKTKYQAI